MIGNARSVAGRHIAVGECLCEAVVAVGYRVVVEVGEEQHRFSLAALDVFYHSLYLRQTALCRLAEVHDHALRVRAHGFLLPFPLHHALELLPVFGRESASLEVAVYHRCPVAVDEHLVCGADAAPEVGVDMGLREYGILAEYHLHIAVGSVARRVDILVFLAEYVVDFLVVVAFLHAHYGGAAAVHVFGYLLQSVFVVPVEHENVVRHHLYGVVGRGVGDVDGRIGARGDIAHHESQHGDDDVQFLEHQKQRQECRVDDEQYGVGESQTGCYRVLLWVQPVAEPH